MTLHSFVGLAIRIFVRLWFSSSGLPVRCHLLCVSVGFVFGFCGCHLLLCLVTLTAELAGAKQRFLFAAGLQRIDAEEKAIYEEMLSAAGMVEEEARQRYSKVREAKEVITPLLKRTARPRQTPVAHRLHYSRANLLDLENG